MEKLEVPKQVNAILEGKSYQSPEQELHSLWVGKEISDDDYYFGNAELAADKLHLYKPKFYADFPQSVDAYIDDRLRGRREFDHDFSLACGAWFLAAQLVFEENQKSIKILSWAVEKLEARGVTHKVPSVRFRIDEIKRVDHPTDICGRILSLMDKDRQDRK